MYILIKTKNILYYIINVIYILLIAIQLNGCATTKTTEITPIDVRQIDSTNEDYYLRAGDTLEIRFFITPELNTILTIRPDGYISLELLDDIKAEGLTVPELDEILTKEYEKQLNKAMLTVIVKDTAGQTFYVGGEVGAPKELTITGKINALQAIFRAGGFKVDANKSEVVIISRGPDHKPVARKVNLKNALKGKVPENEYLLRPFDIVYVPKTRLAEIDDFTAHIYRIIPNRIWRGFVYEEGSSFTVDDFRDRFPETP